MDMGRGVVRGPRPSNELIKESWAERG